MKVAVVGNSCSGKTALSRSLAQKHNLPLIHVDSIQFLPGMKIRPHKESISLLRDVQNQSAWIIDGYGPLDIIEERFKLADRIIFIDFPLWRHFWWCTKRQIQNLWSVRKELPEGCSERSLEHSIKLYKNIWKSHKLMRPELLRIFGREHLKSKMIYVRTMGDWNRLFKNGLK